MSRRRVIWSLIGGVVGVVLFVAVVYLAGPNQVSVVLHADPAWVGVSFAVGLAVTALSAIRWGYITNTLVERRALTWTQYYASLLTSRVIGLFIPRNASDLGVRFVTLVGPGKIGGEFAAASVALDQMFDITLLAVWLVPSVLLLGTLPVRWALLLVPLTAIVTVALMLRLNAVIRWVARMLARLSERLGGEGRVRSFFARRAAGLRDLARVEHFTTRASLVVATMTIVRYLLNATMFWAVAQALNLDVDLWTFLLAGSLVQLSLVVAFTPGGLGIMDLGWVGALALGGVSTKTAAAFIVGQRAFQYTFFPLLAGVSYVIAVVGGRRDRAAQEEVTHLNAEGHPTDIGIIGD